MPFLITLLVNAVILMVLIRFFVGERVQFLRSLLTAALAAVGVAGLTAIFGVPMGQHAGLVAALIVAVCVGVAVSLLFNVDLTSALILGAMFVVLSAGVHYLLPNLLP